MSMSCAGHEQIDGRPAVKRGRIVNKLSGEDSEQLHERHDASDFDLRTEDKIKGVAPDDERCHQGRARSLRRGLAGNAAGIRSAKACSLCLAIASRNASIIRW